MKNELVMWEDIGLLDYIGDVENIYIPSYDSYEYRDSADIIMIPIDDETSAGFTEEEIRLADTRPVEATQCKEKHHLCMGSAQMVKKYLIKI